MPAVRRSKQTVVTEFRCSEILEAARKVFARRGFAGATVEEIAETAGVAKGTVYLYFPSKREVYLEVLRKGIALLIEETARNVAAAPAPADKIRAFIETRVRRSEENREVIMIYHSEFGHINPAHLDKEFRSLYLQQVKMLEGILAEGAALGEIRPLRRDAAAFTLFDMIHGLVMQRIFGWSKETAAADVEFLFEMIWKGLAECTES
jgi:TetR/AcrR family transcriptional regulator